MVIFHYDLIENFLALQGSRKADECQKKAVETRNIGIIIFTVLSVSVILSFDYIIPASAQRTRTDENQNNMDNMNTSDTIKNGTEVRADNATTAVNFAFSTPTINIVYSTCTRYTYYLVPWINGEAKEIKCPFGVNFGVEPNDAVVATVNNNEIMTVGYAVAYLNGVDVVLVNDSGRTITDRNIQIKIGLIIFR